jgi:hypothetical protein
MKRINSILLKRVLLAGLMTAALIPRSNCDADTKSMVKGMQCPNASCCRSHHGCHHPVPKDRQDCVKTRIESAVFNKSVKPDVGFKAMSVHCFALSAARQNFQAFQRVFAVSSTPLRPPVLRI